MKIAKDPAEAGSIVDFVPFFKALCNPTRAQIIEFLLGGERCVCEMTGPARPEPAARLAPPRRCCATPASSTCAPRARAPTTPSTGSVSTAICKSFLGYVERLRSAPPVAERRQRLRHEVPRAAKTPQRILTATTTTRRDT